MMRICEGDVPNGFGALKVEDTYHCKNKIVVLAICLVTTIVCDCPSFLRRFKECSACKTFCGRLVKFIQV